MAIVLLSLAPVAAFAQQLIHGKVTDAKHLPVSFATVALQRVADSTLITTAATDTNGIFVIAGNGAPAYITVTLPGYNTAVKTVDGDSVFFVLQEANRQLSGLTVTASKPMIEHKVDRTVFNVETSIASVGSDALEALKKAPGVRVSNTEIAISGKSSVMVMLNGRLVQFSGEELTALLKSIPADQLARIEVITTPPAKYDAAGNSGIINIVTKKNLRNGLNGNITGSYGQNTFASLATNGAVSYRKDKWNIYGDFFLNKYRAATIDNVFTPYIDQEWRQYNNQQRTSIFDRGHLGVDYNLTPHSVIGLVYTLGGGGYFFDHDEDITTHIVNTSGVLDSMLRTKAHTDETGLRNVAELNYEWEMDTAGKKLTANASYFNRTGTRVRGFTTQDFMGDGLPGGLFSTNRTTGRQDITIKTASVDMDLPTKLAMISFGGKVSFIHNTSDNIYEYADTTGYHTDQGKTNYFDYRENTQALYVNAKRSIKKWEMQLGLRAEYTQTKGYSPTLNQTNLNDYFKLFPTVFVAYTASEKHSFNIAFSRRIERPAFWQLNPFRFYNNANSYSEGNPFLQPSFSTNGELAYSFRSKYTVKAYVQSITALSTFVTIVDTVNKLVISRNANAGKVANYGLSADGSFSPAKRWECTFQVNGYYAVFTSSFYGSNTASYSLPTFYAETNNSFTLNSKRTLLAELGFWYQHRQQSDFDIVASHYNLSAGIKALFFSKRLILAVSGDDILRSTAQRKHNLYNGTRGYYYDDDRNGRFSITWKFGNSNIRQRERKTSDESRRL